MKIDIRTYTDQLEEVKDWHESVVNFFDENGGKWDKTKRYQQVVEEIGEYTQELLDNNEENQRDELGDIVFTYLGYIDELQEETPEDRRAILRYILKTLKNIDCTRKELILLLLAQFTRENKIFRKRDKDPSRSIQWEYTELESKKRQYLNLLLLSLLCHSYETTIKEVVDQSIDKFNKRK